MGLGVHPLRSSSGKGGEEIIASSEGREFRKFLDSKETMKTSVGRIRI